MKHMLLAAAFGLAGLGQAFAQDMSPQDFVNEAASGGMFEVQSSQLALERSQNADVKAFAEKMVADHTPNNEELMAIATAAGLTPPAEIMGANAENMKAVQDATGDAFDKTYAEKQVAAHEAAVTLYQAYAEGGQEQSLKAYAEKSLPVLQEHLENAKAMAAQ